jgi:CO/xanthine dehydrogenase Mo-binding subunit
MAIEKSKEKTSSPIGASYTRNDVYEKVTGTATYTDDIQFGESYCMPA